MAFEEVWFSLIGSNLLSPLLRDRKINVHGVILFKNRTCPHATNAQPGPIPLI
jgi:hypothetical protein